MHALGKHTTAEPHPQPYLLKNKTYSLSTAVRFIIPKLSVSLRIKGAVITIAKGREWSCRPHLCGCVCWWCPTAYRTNISQPSCPSFGPNALALPAPSHLRALVLTWEKLPGPPLSQIFTRLFSPLSSGLSLKSSEKPPGGHTAHPPHPPPPICLHSPNLANPHLQQPF